MKINNKVYFGAFSRRYSLSIKLSVHLVHKPKRWIHICTAQAHIHCCCLASTHSLGLSFVHVYHPSAYYVGDPNTNTQIQAQAQAHTNHWHFIFASVCAKRRYFFRCFVVLLFSCLYYAYMYTGFTRRDTSTFRIHMDLYFLSDFSFVLVFVRFRSFVWFDFTSLLGALCFIEHWTYRIHNNQRANSLKFNLIFVSI